MKTGRWIVRCSLALAFARCAVSSFSQDHAPTAELCKADQAVWGSDYAETQYNEAETRHIEDGTPNRTDIARLTIPQLKQRMKEMYQCEEVIATEPYHQTGNFYFNVIGDRHLGFLVRHGLMSQMMKEDAAGKR
jgi:hypothetical protein